MENISNVLEACIYHISGNFDIIKNKVWRILVYKNFDEIKFDKCSRGAYIKNLFSDLLHSKNRWVEIIMKGYFNLKCMC